MSPSPFAVGITGSPKSEKLDLAVEATAHLCENSKL